MLQWYDILHEQTNFSRTVNANGWTDREVNAITSYAMIHVSYRLNLFGGGGSGNRFNDERGGPDSERGRGRFGGRGGQGGRGGFGNRGGQGDRGGFN